MQNYLLTTNPASGLTIVYGTFFDKLSRGGADIDINYVHDEDLTNAYWAQYITTNYPHDNKRYNLSITYNADKTVSYWDDSHSGGNKRYYSIPEMKDHIFRKYEVTFADRPARGTHYQPYVSWKANLYLINNGHPILRINYGFEINNGIINLRPYNYYFYPKPKN